MKPGGKTPIIKPETKQFYEAFISPNSGLCEDYVPTEEELSQCRAQVGCQLVDKKPTGVLRDTVGEEFTKQVEGGDVPVPLFGNPNDSSTIEARHLAILADFETLCNRPAYILQQRLIPTQFHQHIISHVRESLKIRADYDKKRKVIYKIVNVAEDLQSGRLRLKKNLPETRRARIFRDNLNNIYTMGILLGSQMGDMKYYQQAEALHHWLQQPQNAESVAPKRSSHPSR